MCIYIHGRTVLRNRQVIHVLGIKWLLISIVTGVRGFWGMSQRAREESVVISLL